MFVRSISAPIRTSRGVHALMQSTVARVVLRVLAPIRRVLERPRKTPQQTHLPALGGRGEWSDSGEFRAAGVPRRPRPSSAHGSVALIEP